MEKANSLVTITDLVGVPSIIQSSRCTVANDIPVFPVFVSYSGSESTDRAIVTVITVAMCVVRYTDVTKAGYLANTKLKW